MIRNTLMAAAVALTAGVIAIPRDADAMHKKWHDDDDVNVQLQFGFGDPGYYGHPGYYDPGYRYPRRYNRVSCGEARGILRDRGYNRIRTIECRGTTYTFRVNRGRVVYVSARNGRVWRG